MLRHLLKMNLITEDEYNRIVRISSVSYTHLGYHNDGWYAKNCKTPDSRLWQLMNEAKEFNASIGNKLGNYPKEDYTDFLDFRKSIATQYGAKIILKKSGE